MVFSGNSQRKNSPNKLTDRELLGILINRHPEYCHDLLVGLAAVPHIAKEMRDLRRRPPAVPPTFRLTTNVGKEG